MKECPYLENAIIFKRLFNVEENSLFGKYYMKKNDNNELTLLQDYGITANDWDLIIHYLRYGFTFAYHDDSEYKRIKYLNRTSHIFTILGGIQSFDEFYLNFQKNKEKQNNIYNPLCPGSDNKMKYEWTVSTSYRIMEYPDF